MCVCVADSLCVYSLQRWSMCLALRQCVCTALRSASCCWAQLLLHWRKAALQSLCCTKDKATACLSLWHCTHFLNAAKTLEDTNTHTHTGKRTDTEECFYWGTSFSKGSRSLQRYSSQTSTFKFVHMYWYVDFLLYLCVLLAWDGEKSSQTVLTFLREDQLLSISQ